MQTTSNQTRKPILLSWSGGKDSAWALHLLHLQNKFEVVGLLTTINEKFRRVAIHGFREELLDQQAASIGLPLWKVDLPFPCSNADYESRMAAVCARAVAEGLHGIAFGDLFLEDIRAYRIARLAGTGLEPIFPVWTPDLGISTAELASQMIASGLRAHLTCIDPRALNSSFAGRTFDAALLADLPPSVDPCGERGEFHTFAFAGPVFSRPLSVLPGEVVERDNFIYADLLPAGPQAISTSHVKPKTLRAALICLLVLAAAAFTAPAQILARPGWNGAPFNTQPWWKEAIFYDLTSSPQPDFAALTTRLDSLRALHVDALILSAPPLPPPGSGADMPNLDTLDDLTREASATGIHILLTIPASVPAVNLPSVARFWLDRGIAGLHIASPGDPNLPNSAVTLLAGRLLISDRNTSVPDAQPAPTPDRRATRRRVTSPPPAALQLDSRLIPSAQFDAATLRLRLIEAATQPTLLLDLPAPSPALARAAAAIALLTQPAAVFDSSADLVLVASTQSPTEPRPATDAPIKPAPLKPAALPPGTYLPYVPYTAQPKARATPASTQQPEDTPLPTDPLTAWYSQLASMHHSNAVLRTGPKSFLDFNQQNALVWVSRPVKASSVDAPVVVICNLSAAPVQLSLTSAMKQLNLRGWFLRTLLRSDIAMGAQNLDSVSVPAYGVYIGELRR